MRQKHCQAIAEGALIVNLETADRYAAAFGLESRHPFLDRRLFEFCLAVPSEQKFKAGFGRIIMRQSLINILPKSVQWRGDKANMTANFINGLLDVNRSSLEQVLNSDNSSVLKYVNTDDLENAWDRVKQYPEADQRISQMTDDCLTVWKATVLKLWLQRM